MGLCKDCQHWERRRSSTKWRPCVLTRVGDRNEEQHPDSRAIAYFSSDGWDAEHEGAVLLTRPEFGCTQFEAR